MFSLQSDFLAQCDSFHHGFGDDYPCILNFYLHFMCLDYSRAEVAVDVRRKGGSCGGPPQLLCNEADTVRSARPQGKKCRL